MEEIKKEITELQRRADQGDFDILCLIERIVEKMEEFEEKLEFLDRVETTFVFKDSK